MVRLTQLHPHWINRVSLNEHWEDQVSSLAEAQAIRFLCPVCFQANNGPIGTHSIIVPFRNRDLPDEWMPRMARWEASGTTFEDLTTTPSILLSGEGCGWHGFITNGEVT